MHIIEKNTIEARPAEAPQTVLMESSNQPHCERQATSKASARLVVELERSAGAVGPQPDILAYRVYATINETLRQMN